jgi:hypothetical protein
MEGFLCCVEVGCGTGGGGQVAYARHKTCRTGVRIGVIVPICVPIPVSRKRHRVLSPGRSVPPAYAPRPDHAVHGAVIAIFPNPPIPEHPADKRSEAAPANNGHGADSFLEDANEADDEYDDGADVLDNHGRVGH